MSASAAPSSNQLHADEQSLAEYSAVSRPAVLSVFLGLASALMLVTPLLVLVPLAAVGSAVVALRQIAASGGQLTGRVPATIGLCLAMLFVGWGISRQWTRQAAVVTEGRRLADSWLETVRQGKLQQADQMFRAPGDRLSSEQSLAEYYRTNKEASENMQGVFGGEPMKSFCALGKSAIYRYQTVAAQSRSGFTDDVVLHYFFSSADGTSPEKSMWISVSRTLDYSTKQPGWRMSRVDGSPPGQVQ
jgi:hypothetical protein